MSSVSPCHGALQHCDLDLYGDLVKIKYLCQTESDDSLYGMVWYGILYGCLQHSIYNVLLESCIM